MICYVSHSRLGEKNYIEKVTKITHNLQTKDLVNCYVCPLLTFSHIEHGDISNDDEIELRLDLLSACDRLIVTGEILKDVQMEIDFAKLVKMEVMRLDKNGELRPFTE